jgi:hypothetical protein
MEGMDGKPAKDTDTARDLDDETTRGQRRGTYPHIGGEVDVAPGPREGERQ